VSSLRRLYIRAWGQRQRVDRIAVVLLSAIVVGGIVLVATANDEQAPRSTGTADSGRARPCKDLNLSGRLTGRVTCQAKTATLSIAGQDLPVLLEGTQARVYRAQALAGGLNVRMRLRNETTQPRPITARSRQFYLSTAGNRVFASSVTPATTLKPSGAATLMVRFPVDTALRKRLARERTVDLGVVPFTEVGSSQPSQLGVVRLHVTGV
jgi:hypothetical protein